MRKAVMSFMLIGLLAMNVFLPQASAQTADGTYSLPYQVNQPESNSASIANDYFVKPANVTMKSGTATVQITLKNSSWITKFNPPGGATVISEDAGADTRVVQFTVKDLSKPVNTAMKVDVEDINYHHDYTVGIVFDALPAASGDGAAVTDDKATTTTPDGTTDGKSDATTDATSPGAASDQEKNPQTSDSTPYLIFAALAGSAFLLYRTKTKSEVQS